MPKLTFHPSYSLLLTPLCVAVSACSFGTTERSSEGPATPATAPQAGPGAPDPGLTEPPAGSEPPAGTGKLAASFASLFEVGVAVEPRHLLAAGMIIGADFNRLTAENAMKFSPIHPDEQRYAFDNADAVADFARDHDQKMTGHALVWHRQTPTWFTQSQDPTIVTAALKDHIDTVVSRYADVTDNWDVVNEAISDTAGKTYRDEAEGSRLHPIFGPDFIKLAFQLAEDAVAASSQDVALYYNDYNVVVAEKRDKIVEMVRWLKAAGAPIDGIGLQAHWTIDWPSIPVIQETIDVFVAEGLQVKISELDVSVYTRDNHASESWQAELEFSSDLETLQAQRYRELFELFVKNAVHISSVTFWGLSDDQTWLNSFPAANRPNYPLLFDRQHNPKAAYFSVLETAPAQE